jgi:disulfide oxidoreductase YuzD
MTAAKQKAINWLSDVEKGDFAAAKSYLGLLFGDNQVKKMVAKLKHAEIVRFKAKDIFRASRLSLLGISNSHIEKDREKIQRRQGLSPLLLVRDERNGKVVIADGYHRLCAIYEVDEDAVIHCKIV